ncbi:antitoxin [Kitasatospora sp. NBC_01287]|uniref:antitoxin n=1 Tax=Kitasatospora sp. NBC_01287 TaxID=2903573 RepID=UPI002256F6F6|nr:antitoxin [Kitasatospora sp. NBC_01287]MCX4746510.1 antitoxin [Kitasatospora sp. NBC_01287]
MGVISWFRRRIAEVPTAADGGSVAVLDPQEQVAPGTTGGEQQESPPGVPAARTAPEAELGGSPAPVDEGGAADESAAATLLDVPAILSPDVAELLAAALAAAAQSVEPAEDALPPSRPERPDTGDEAMGLMDNLKGKAEELKDRASALAGQHNEKIDDLVDKAGGAIDKATKGKYSDKIATGAEKAKGAVDDFAEKGHPGEEPTTGGADERPGRQG